jgi:hypothetical protein
MDKIILLLLVGVIGIILFHFMKKENFTYCRRYNTELPRVLREVLDEFSASITDLNDSCELYLPNYHNDNELEFVDYYIPRTDKYLTIYGAKELDRKNKIWNHLKQKYGRDKASTLIPECYDMNIDDEEEMVKDGNYYVMKGEVENAKGIIISNDKDKMKKEWLHSSTGYPFTIVQKAIKNPMLIKGRVYKLRMYVLVTCHNKEVNAYVHEKGGVFYAKKKFNPKRITYDNLVANSYWMKMLPQKFINEFMKELPEDLEEFQRYMALKNINVEDMYDKIDEKLRHIISAIDLCQKKPDKKMVNMYGIDMIFDENHEPWFIEMNAKPSLRFFNNRGLELKKGVWRDMFNMLIHDETKNMRQIL